eukprot:CAMPEP_0198499492 /NCGR_PEP_ID=MMETSP1462-20131121/7646_1 /TAXON_ID=1333877 /ORGANISM="Brandtodinium nutriculum, Strain RCC3387" /LENGTH=169 /DNA_ID=CAMNT_0044228473 /DNA_START=295 /DNA_END=801 /DNA_ORIENTATION=-
MSGRSSIHTTTCEQITPAIHLECAADQYSHSVSSSYIACKSSCRKPSGGATRCAANPTACASAMSPSVASSLASFVTPAAAALWPASPEERSPPQGVAAVEGTDTLSSLSNCERSTDHRTVCRLPLDASDTWGFSGSTTKETLCPPQDLMRHVPLSGFRSQAPQKAQAA